MKDRTQKRQTWWETKPIRVIVISICLCLAILASAFTALGIVLAQSTNKKIGDVGEVFMQGMGRQVVRRYETLIEQRLSMVTALRDTNPAQAVNGEQVREELTADAAARGFQYLAFADHDGNFDMLPIHADSRQIELYDQDKSLYVQKIEACGLGAGEGQATHARIPDEDGGYKGVVIFGVPTKGDAAYKMTNGNDSVALIVGLTPNTIISMLNADNQYEGRYFTSHIVRGGDGQFVIRDEEHAAGDSGHVHLEGTSYFDYMRDELRVSEETLNRHIAEMREYFAEGKIYSVPIRTKLGNLHLHCEMIRKTDWYLITLMSYDSLEEAVRIKGMTTTWVVLFIACCLVVVLAILIVFSVYYRLNRINMRRLQDAEHAATKANRAKSEFLSNMSHDIRTPMNSIVGMTAIAMAHLDNQKQVQECLKKISLSSKHLLGLINDVLDMSKIESGKMTLSMEQVSLREVMDGISTIAQPQIKLHGQHFDIYIKDILCEDVYCDSVRLNQVLLNLVSNAIKFTPEGGRVEVMLYQELSPRGEKLVRTHVHVRDNGIGMSEEFRKKIFESFVREDSARVQKTEGTGLGMAITKYIVDAMNGTIEVTSEQGKGTEFHVILDLERVADKDDVKLLPNWNMLVVDDDELLCKTTADSLKEIGVSAEWTLDGETALQKAVEAQRKGQGYDIIMLDWKLPGIDGVETARRMRQSLGGDIPILLISAYDWSDMENAARGAGINGFISKPLFKSTLFYGLQKYSGDIAEAAEEPRRPNEKEDWQGVKLLLAEDNDLNWEIAEELLTEVGIEADHAENGQVCVEMLNSSEPGTYDAVLMDLRMPIMTGYEATVEIRKLSHPDAGIPIIAMTADAFADDVKKCLDCGMNAHVSKPIDMEVLCTVLAKFIKRKK